jgi:hypothetical protein
MKEIEWNDGIDAVISITPNDVPLFIELPPTEGPIYMNTPRWGCPSQQ